MTNYKRTSAAILAALAFFVASSQAIILNFSDLPNAQISFSNGSFSFTPTTAYQFDITSVSNGIGDSVGLDGEVNPGGPFVIGAITSTNITQNIPPFGSISYTLQSASVTGTSALMITDTNGVNLTGSISWDNISSLSSPFGSSGTLDLSGTINLTDIKYLGLNSDLGTLAAAGSAVDTVSFQFTSSESLSQLVSSTGEATSFAGTISTAAVPEPSSSFLMAIGFAFLLGLAAHRRRQSRLS